MSVLLVDRTLDLPNIVGHHVDNLVDKIVSTLDELPGHSTDITVNMTTLCTVER